MTQPDGDAWLAPEPEPPQPDAIGWRYVGVALVLALIGLAATMIVIQRQDSPGVSAAPSAKLQVLSAAAEKTAALNRMHVDMLMGFSGGATGPLAVSMGGDVSNTPPAGRVVGTLPGGGIEERVVGDTVYMSVGGRTFDGRQWVAVHINNPQEAFRVAGDPVAMLRAVADATGVQELGRMVIDGVTTTHYRASIDADDAYAQVQDQFKLAPDEDPPSGGTVTTDLYVAGDGTVRRVENVVKVDDFTVSMTATFRPIHHAVHVTAPPATEVREVADLAEALRLMSGR